MTAPLDLASLADCKAWLGLTSTADDALLAGLVTSVSQAILADLGRTLLPADTTEVLDNSSSSSVPLRQWPVMTIGSCTVAGRPLAPHNYALEPADTAPPGRPQRLMLHDRSFAAGGSHVTIVYRAGYEIVAEAAIVPLTTPYLVTAQAPFGAWALDTGVSGAPSPYSVAAGVYTFSAAAAGAAIALSYGYVPADLARAAIEWVADRYVSRTRVGQSAKTLGGQETASFIVKAMPDVVNRLLQPYRRVAG